MKNNQFRHPAFVELTPDTNPMVKLAKKNLLKWNLVKKVMGLEKSTSKERQEFLLRNTNKQLAIRIEKLKPSA